MKMHILFAALVTLALVQPTAGQIKKPGVSYKKLLKGGGHVVGLRAGSLMIQKDNVLYNCRLATIRKSMVRWCKALKAEGEDKR
jgi:hypothetical protein